jgi:hypothetical protein
MMLSKFLFLNLIAAAAGMLSGLARKGAKVLASPGVRSLGSSGIVKNNGALKNGIAQNGAAGDLAATKIVDEGSRVTWMKAAKSQPVTVASNMGAGAAVAGVGDGAVAEEIQTPSPFLFVAAATAITATICAYATSNAADAYDHGRCMGPDAVRFTEEFIKASAGKERTNPS